MKIVASKENLTNAMNTVMKAIPTRTTMAILEYVMVTAGSGKIIFSSSDSEMYIKTELEGQIVMPGKVAIPAKIINDMIRKMPGADITIETDVDYNILITSEKTKFKLAGRSGDDYPEIPYTNEDKFIKISQLNLREMIRQTIFSIAENSTNHMLSGELMEVTGNMMRLVSLDGQRSSIRRLELKERYENEKVIIPGKTLSDISKIIIGGIEDEVTIFFARDGIQFSFDKTLIYTRLIEGNYFKIDQMINNNYSTKITINRNSLINSMDRAMLLGKENDKKPLIFNIKDNVIELNIISPLGSFREEIDCIKEGNDLMIGFNPYLFSEMIKAIDEEEITMYMTNGKSPCFIRDENDTYVYLILPVNFNI